LEVKSTFESARIDKATNIMTARTATTAGLTEEEEEKQKKQKKDPRSAEYLTHLSLDKIAAIIAESDKTIPWISVGSGNGYVEAVLHKKTRRSVTCVDPHPTEWLPYDPELKTEPQYVSVASLITAEPKVVGACNLILCWPYSEASTFDLKAIRDLQPLSIVIVLMVAGRTGKAGGFSLHHWMARQTDYAMTIVDSALYVPEDQQERAMNASLYEKPPEYQTRLFKRTAKRLNMKRIRSSLAAARRDPDCVVQ
jgi:hypothetical protein